MSSKVSIKDTSPLKTDPIVELYDHETGYKLDKK